MPAKQLYNTCLGVLLWLSKAQVAWASTEPLAARDPPHLRYTQHSAHLYKRDSTPKVTYIAIIVAVVGTAALATIGICWDLNRRRRASKLRDMEEARHPREPISYDHFPVEPGEASEHSEVGAGITHPPNLAMTASSNRCLTLPPSVVSGSGPVSPPSSFNPTAVVPPESPHYVYDENSVPPPPFSADVQGRLVPPPGLEDHHSSSRGTESPNNSAGSHVSSRHALPLTPPPSRPPTASAPPAYTPSDPESAHSTSLVTLEQGSQHSLPTSHPTRDAAPGPPHQNS